jgi:hypothetical protein
MFTVVITVFPQVIIGLNGVKSEDKMMAIIKMVLKLVKQSDR